MSKPATRITSERNRVWGTSELGQDAPSLLSSSHEDEALTSRGFLVALDPPRIGLHSDLGPLVDMFSQSSEAPPSANPSLWRQSRLNSTKHGLFRVCDGVYQVRGYDIANITFVRGNTGWVVVDPLTCTETARAALELVDQHFGARPVSAVIITHSHADHYGGILGVLSAEDVAARKTPILAPEGFYEAALTENVLAGTVMSRRSSYMYGMLLPVGPQGTLGTGLGNFLARGETVLQKPTDIVARTGESHTLDGVELEFMMAQGAEAPSEMMFFLPKHRALCLAEICNCCMHNVVTPRGAKTRDAKLWAQHIDEAMRHFAGRADVAFGCHHWPRWGRAALTDYLRKQRDLYKLLHDQALRLTNRGFKPREIAEIVRPPSALAEDPHLRGYYGAASHNVKAVYDFYLGWFDGSPCSLNPLPERETGRRYIKCMGGAEVVLGHAKQAFDAGDYRWVAELLAHLNHAEPGHEGGRALLADTLEQLGYVAESAPWRNFYLSGAKELRMPPLSGKAQRPAWPLSPQTLLMPTVELLSVLATRLLPDAASKLQAAVLHASFSDTGEDITIELSNCTLHAFEGKLGKPDASIQLTRDTLFNIMRGEVCGFVESGAGALELGITMLGGDKKHVEWLCDASVFEPPFFFFPIVDNIEEAEFDLEVQRFVSAARSKL